MNIIAADVNGIFAFFSATATLPIDRIDIKFRTIFQSIVFPPTVHSLFMCNRFTHTHIATIFTPNQNLMNRVLISFDTNRIESK